MFFKFFYLLFCPSCFNCLWASNLFLYSCSNVGNSLRILHQFMNFLYLCLFFLIIFLLKGFQDLFNSVQSQHNLVLSVFKIFQTCHNFQKLLDIVSNWFVSNLDVLFCDFKELRKVSNLMLKIILHNGAIKLI